MKIAESYNEFRALLKRNEKKVTGLLPSEGIPLFQSFYKEVRCVDAQVEQGDGLASYFGMSRDGGMKFEVGIIRLFRLEGAPPQSAGHRLRLSFVYPFLDTIVRPGLDQVPGWPEGNRFCWSPADQSEIDYFVANSVHIQAVFAQPPKETKLRLEKLWGVF